MEHRRRTYPPARSVTDSTAEVGVADAIYPVDSDHWATTSAICTVPRVILSTEYVVEDFTVFPGGYPHKVRKVKWERKSVKCGKNVEKTLWKRISRLCSFSKWIFELHSPIYCPYDSTKIYEATIVINPISSGTPTNDDSSEHSRISVLPYQVTTQILKNLSPYDILNFCSAFPQWSSFPTTRKARDIFNQDIKNWKWIDRHLYNLLQPKKSSSGEFGNVIRAVQYYHKYNACIKDFEKKASSKGFSICESILTQSLPKDSKIPFNFDSVTTIDNAHIDELHLESRKMAAFSLDGYNYDSIFYYKPLLWKRRRNIEMDSCIIYFAHSSWQDRGDLQDIFIDLRPDQTAVIVVVKDSGRELNGYKNNIDFLTGFLEKEMGGLENSPLAKTLSNWCLWVLESGECKYLNVIDVYKWTCFHILKRKMILKM